jgi:RimJ/RimL family protein N-acetyltransferase
MVKVEKIALENRQRIIEYLKLDLIRHVFAFYDLQHEFEHTVMHVAFENNEIAGYVLTYVSADVPSVVLECRSDVAKTLLKHAPEGSFILHTSPNHLRTIKERFPDAKVYVENWMLVKRSEAKAFRSKMVKKLQTTQDADRLASLLLERKDRPERNRKRYADWIAKMPIYGVFENRTLVSYAGSFIQLPEIWMIGGVYTLPEKRNRGYALLATSAVTQEALHKAEAAALFVRSDNSPAIAVYEKIGYRKIGEKIWVDEKTGLMP